MDNITSPYLILHRNMRSENWNSDAIMRAIMVDEHLAKNVAARQKAWEIIGERLDFSIDTSQSGISLAIDCIGNKGLLYADEKVSLICHRADEAFFARQAQSVLDAARHGCVVVSAFISSKEREVKRLLMQESLPVIEVMNDGFSPQYHPYGASYDACVAGKLVQLSPWAFSPQSGNKLTREVCLVTNELVRVISKTPDDWWKRD